MTQFIEELGPLKNITATNAGIQAGDFEWSEELAPDQFIRVYSIQWLMNPGAADEYLIASFQGTPQDTTLAYVKSTSMTTAQGVINGPIDSNLGNLLEILTIHANANTVSRMCIVYRVVTVRQLNGQPITPSCSIWKRLLGVC